MMNEHDFTTASDDQGNLGAPDELDDATSAPLDVLEPDFVASMHPDAEIVEEAHIDLTDDADVDADDAVIEESTIDVAHSEALGAADLGAAPAETDDDVAKSLMRELEADIDLIDAAMHHLDNNDLDAADNAVSQLDQGADPTLFAAVAAGAAEEFADT